MKRGRGGGDSVGKESEEERIKGKLSEGEPKQCRGRGAKNERIRKRAEMSVRADKERIK